MTDEEKELVKGKLKEVLKQAVKDADRSGKWGSVGGSMRNKLREMVSNDVDWRSILKQFCGLSRRGTRTTTWSNINVRFYIFAILFLIFDVEAVFLFPWAVIFMQEKVNQANVLPFYAMMMFLGVLFFAIIYAWKKGVLEWQK